MAEDSRPKNSHPIRAGWIGLVLVAAWIALFAAPLMRTADRLVGNGWTVASHWDDYRRAWRTERAGEQALTETAMEIVHLLRTAEARSYRYSDGVAADELVRQRVLEGAWPIRFDEQADVIVGLRAEPLPCPTVYTTEAAQLARCD